MDYIYHYDSSLGGITLASDGTHHSGLWFDDQKYFADILTDQSSTQSLPIFDLAHQWLDIYFNGQAPDFTPPLSLHTTEFRRQVWEIMLTIPFNQTMTYGDIAAKLAQQRQLEHMSAQAVGGAVVHNAISLIIPCHRVVDSNGSLTDYAGGIDRKIKLLTMEQMDTRGSAATSYVIWLVRSPLI